MCGFVNYVIMKKFIVYPEAKNSIYIQLMVLNRTAKSAYFYINELVELPVALNNLQLFKIGKFKKRDVLNNLPILHNKYSMCDYCFRISLRSLNSLNKIKLLFNVYS